MREKMSNAFFYIGILLELAVSFTGFAFGGYHESLIILGAMVAFSISILCDLEIKKMWPFYIGLGLLSGMFYLVQRRALVLRVVLALLAGRKKNAKPVVRIFFVGTLLVTFVLAVLSYAGKAGVLYTDGAFRLTEERRYQFGYIHPNAFSLFWFRTIIMGLYGFLPSKEDKKPKTTLAIFSLSLLGMVPLFYSNSKSALAVTAFAILGNIIVRYVPWKKMPKLVFILGNVGFAGIAYGIYSLITWFYIRGNALDALWWKILLLTSGRSVWIRELFESRKPSLLGDKSIVRISEVGFMDTMYCEGILFLVLYILALLFAYYRMYKKKDMAGMIFIFAFTMYALSEAFIPYFNKNGVWFMLLGLSLDTYVMDRKKENTENGENV